MLQIVLIIHVVIAIALIALILVQQGKGAGMGASFGAGASQTVFGSQGSGSFLLKLTGGLGLLFFVTTLTLLHLASRIEKPNQNNMLDQVAKISQQQKQNTPANASALQAVQQLNAPTKPSS